MPSLLSSDIIFVKKGLEICRILDPQAKELLCACLPSHTET